MSDRLPPSAEARQNAAVARTLQEGLAPRELPAVPGLTVSAGYRASGLDDVGGDWYDLLDLPTDNVALVLGDVAGHGITAAVTMGHLRHAARAYLLEDHNPATALGRLNRLALWILPGEIATAVIAVLPRDGGPVALCTAGHPPPLLLDGGAATYLDLPRGPALGVTEGAAYSVGAHDLSPTGMLVLFTDGLVERRGESIDDGLERLRLRAEAHGPGDDLCDVLMAAIPQESSDDDMAVVSVRRSGGR